MSITVEKIFVGTQHIKKIVEDLELVKQALESIGTDYLRTTLHAKASDTGNVVELQTESETYKNLRVRIYEGNAGVQVITQAMDGRSTSLYGLVTGAFLYGFNESSGSWYRLRCDEDKYLIVRLPEMKTPSLSGTLIGLVGISGKGAVLLVKDTTTYSVTSTTWTEVKRWGYSLGHGYVLVLGIAIKAYIDTAGETLYIRFKNRAGEIIGQVSFTNTSETWKWVCTTTRHFGYPDVDVLIMEAYVTGGTGYITYVSVVTNPSLVPIMGWTGDVGEGFYLRPIKVDSEGRVYCWLG